MRISLFQIPVEPEVQNFARRRLEMLTVKRTRRLCHRMIGLLCGGALVVGLNSPAVAQAVPPAPERVQRALQVQSVVDPLSLAEQRTSKASAVLKRHCARCHDNQQLRHPLAAAGIANILDLSALARRRDLIRPGYPDASPLYLSMLTRHMPYDVYRQLSSDAEPDASELEAVRDWIQALPNPEVCLKPRSGPQEIARLIEQDLERFGPSLAETRRYLSLGHLVSPCSDTGPSGLAEGYRQAVAKLLNLLSLHTGTVRPETIDENGLVLGFDFSQLGWTAQQWAWLAQRYVAPVSVPINKLSKATAGKSLPVLPADWFAHEVMKPDVYDRLLHLPGHFKTLLAAMGFSQAEKAPSRTVEASEVTGTLRSISRYVTREGTAAWLAKDFNAETAPIVTNLKRANHDPVQVRLIFQLANGFPGFALYGRHGSRRAAVHKSVLPETVAAANAGQAGLQCLSCHFMGPSQINMDRRGPGSGDLISTDDKRAAEVALQIAGIDPKRRIDGHDPVIGLALRHKRDLSLTEAAAELALPTNVLVSRLRGLEGELRPIAGRLLQGLVSRDEFTQLAAAINSHSNGHAARPRHAPLRLSLWTEQQSYAKNDIVKINAAATAPCRLTLISVDSHGQAAVLFPNEFQRDNWLPAGRIIQVPSNKDGFILRAAVPGKDAIVGICMAGERKNPPGVSHDFKLHRFTLLGNWRSHLNKALLADEAERKQVGKPRKKTKRRRKRRGSAKPLPDRSSKLPLSQAWATIVLEARPTTDGDPTRETKAAFDRASKQPRYTAQE